MPEPGEHTKPHKDNDAWLAKAGKLLAHYLEKPTLPSASPQETIFFGEESPVNKQDDENNKREPS